VIEAADGATAIDAALTQRPALILLDLVIPEPDGWEVARRLKADPRTTDIPLVALTAHAFASDAARARAVGCDGFIAKPAKPRTVLAEVQRRVGHAGRAATA
jgi:CheY-like chemotaxis protein